MTILDCDSIVIIGAGSIGLASAYHLAIAQKSPRPKIKVIDVFDEPFTAASSTCTGCIHYGFPDAVPSLLRLGKYSFDLWAAEAQKRDFREANGSYGLTLGMGSGRLISQLMLGDEPDIDISEFTLASNDEEANETASADEVVAEAKL